MLQMWGKSPQGPASAAGEPQTSPQGPQPPSEAQRPSASPHAAPEDRRGGPPGGRSQRAGHSQVAPRMGTQAAPAGQGQGGTESGPPQGAGGFPWHPCHTGACPGATSGPDHPGRRNYGGFRTQEGPQTGKDQVAGRLRAPRGSDHRGRDPKHQFARSPGGGSNRKAHRPRHRGGRSRTAVRRLRKLGRTSWGIILWLVAAPLRWCPPDARAPPSPEPQAPFSQQLTESSVAPGPRGTLQTRVEEAVHPLKPVGNTGEFWTAPPPGDVLGRTARGFSSARHAPRGTHAEVMDKAHRPRQCEQGGGPLAPGVGVPRKSRQCRPHLQGERSHPGWPGWRDPPGVFGLQPRGVSAPERGSTRPVAPPPGGRKGDGHLGAKGKQLQGGWREYGMFQ